MDAKYVICPKCLLPYPIINDSWIKVYERNPKEAVDIANNIECPLCEYKFKLSEEHLSIDGKCCYKSCW
jgi:hypothetical protein